MSAEWCRAAAGAIRLSVQVVPNAKKSEVAGLLDDALKIRLQAQPIEGQANEALIRYLSDLLEIPKSAVVITRGHTGKRKTVELHAADLTVDAVRLALLPH